MDREWLEGLLDMGYSLERIGRLVDKHPSTVGYWVKRHGLVASNREKYAPKGGIAREPLRLAVDAGLSVPRLAERFGVRVPTVRYWLKQYGIETVQARRSRMNREARAQNQPEAEMTCARHGRTKFRRETTGRYRCVRCNSEGVSRHRRRLKETLVQEAGGRCVICGYDRYQGALQFHHLERGKKSFALGHDGVTRALVHLRDEVQKCALVCANCHAEVEAGVTALPFSGPTDLRCGTTAGS